MKKTIIFVMTIMTLSFTCFSQTTIEEYNYITKGYKSQVIDQGGDMKKGYELEEVDKISAGGRTAVLKKLLKVNGDQKTIAAYMIVYQKDASPKEYICVPNPTSEKEVTDAFWKVLYENPLLGDGTTRLQIISYLLSRRIAW